MGKGGAIFNAGEIVVASASSFNENTAAARPLSHELCTSTPVLWKVHGFSRKSPNEKRVYAVDADLVLDTNRFG